MILIILEFIFTVIIEYTFGWLLHSLRKVIVATLKQLKIIMKNVITFSFLLIFTLISCGSIDINRSKDIDDEQIKSVDVIVNKMQSNIDSASILCDYALKDYKDKVSIHEIILTYGPLVNQLEKRAVEIFKEATFKYKHETLSQESYDNIRTKVFSDSVQAKINRLKSLGIDFNP